MTNALKWGHEPSYKILDGYKSWYVWIQDPDLHSVISIAMGVRREKSVN